MDLEHTVRYVVGVLRSCKNKSQFEDTLPWGVKAIAKSAKEEKSIPQDHEGKRLEKFIPPLSKGNPGAISALCELVRCGDKNDKAKEVEEYLRMLEVLGVTGTDIYVLFNDICDRDSRKMLIVLWAVRNEHYDAIPFSLACSKQDYSGKDIIPVDDLVEIFNKKGFNLEW